MGKDPPHNIEGKMIVYTSTVTDSFSVIFFCDLTIIIGTVLTVGYVDSYLLLYVIPVCIIISTNLSYYSAKNHFDIIFGRRLSLSPASDCVQVQRTLLSTAVLRSSILSEIVLKSSRFQHTVFLYVSSFILFQILIYFISNSQIDS